MNVLVATGQRELDQFITQLTNTSTPPIAYKEGVLTLCRRYKPDVVVLSAFLDGGMKNEDLLYQLRKQGARVVILIGNTKPEEIRQKWIPLGVYDYITDPVTEEKIRLSLEYPATLGMAEERLQQIERGELDNEESPQEDEPKKKRRSLWNRKKQEDQKQDDNQNTQADLNTPVMQPNTFSQSIEQETSWSMPETYQEQPQENTQWSFGQSEFVPPEQENITQPIQMADNTPDEEQITENEQSKDKNSNPKLEKEELLNQQEEPTNYTSENTGEWEQHKDKDDSKKKAITSVWNFQQAESVQSVSLPQGYNIIVTSPVSAGKTYIAMNLAATLSKQGANTELVAFEGNEDIWQYLDMPLMKQGTPHGLPNLTISPFKKMMGNAQYRVIDLPYEEWSRAKDWNDSLFLYVTDMDVVHHRQAERAKDEWQGHKVLQVLNQFVSNVLDSGQEQKIRLDADIVLDDQPHHYLAMRFGRPVIATNQAAAREFEMTAKTVQQALPQSGQNNVFSINRSS